MKMNEIICGDCIDVMKDIPDKSIDLILTDPPYPDYHQELYGFKKELIDGLKKFECRQLIFWSAKVDFPLDYTAIHIWDKTMGVGSEYERIFERNGNIQFRMFRGCPIQNKICAQMSRDIFTGHPSQKPIKLIKKLILRYSKEGDAILDPFLGSGTTAVACKSLGRNYIGIDISPEYCQIARDRLNATEKPLF